MKEKNLKVIQVSDPPPSANLSAALTAYLSTPKFIKELTDISDELIT